MYDPYTSKSQLFKFEKIQSLHWIIKKKYKSCISSITYWSSTPANFNTAKETKTHVSPIASVVLHKRWNHECTVFVGKLVRNINDVWYFGFVKTEAVHGLNLEIQIAHDGKNKAYVDLIHRQITKHFRPIHQRSVTRSSLNKSKPANFNTWQELICFCLTFSPEPSCF